MLALTERAGALLKQVQEEQSLPYPLRIEALEDNLVMRPLPATPEDEVLYYDETPVLSLSAEASEALLGCTLTTEETPEGTALTLIPPGEPGPGSVSNNGHREIG